MTFSIVISVGRFITNPEGMGRCNRVTAGPHVHAQSGCICYASVSDTNVQIAAPLGVFIVMSYTVFP